MSSTNTASTRVCPVCDAKNNNLSLFCAECGASMNLPAEGETAAFEPVAAGEDDAQTTAPFVPAAPDESASNTTSTSPSVPASTVNPYPTTWNTPGSTPDAEAEWTALDQPVLPVRTYQPELGMRGFWLGLIAVLLLLAVFLLWGWATLLNQSTRDSVQDFFGFIG